jgi:hypothetical protein
MSPSNVKPEASMSFRASTETPFISTRDKEYTYSPAHINIIRIIADIAINIFEDVFICLGAISVYLNIIENIAIDEIILSERQ